MITSIFESVSGARNVVGSEIGFIAHKTQRLITFTSTTMHC